MILRIILYIMAVVSVWYSYMIYRVHSGTGFFIVGNRGTVLFSRFRDGTLIEKWRFYDKDT